MWDTKCLPLNKNKMFAAVKSGSIQTIHATYIDHIATLWLPLFIYVPGNSSIQIRMKKSGMYAMRLLNIGHNCMKWKSLDTMLLCIHIMHCVSQPTVARPSYSSFCLFVCLVLCVWWFYKCLCTEQRLKYTIVQMHITSMRQGIIHSFLFRFILFLFSTLQLVYFFFFLSSEICS